MQHDFLSRSSGKFPGATEHLKRYSCFSGRIIPNGNSCSASSKTSLAPAPALRGRLSVHATDWWKYKRLSDVNISWWVTSLPWSKPWSLPDIRLTCATANLVNRAGLGNRKTNVRLCGERLWYVTVYTAAQNSVVITEGLSHPIYDFIIHSKCFFVSLWLKAHA